MENVNDKIIIYQTDDGNVQIDVRLENETVWLTQAQMVELFQTTKQNVSLHVNNVYKERELEEKSTVKEYLTVQNEGKRSVRRMVKYYNLDVIISVGYRVKSQRGTQFRIWANRLLKEYLVKGYAVNEQIHKEQIGELRQLVGMLGRTIQNQPLLSNDETNALFDVVVDYTYALNTLDSYDYQRLTVSDTMSISNVFELTTAAVFESAEGCLRQPATAWVASPLSLLERFTEPFLHLINKNNL